MIKTMEKISTGTIFSIVFVAAGSYFNIEETKAQTLALCFLLGGHLHFIATLFVFVFGTTLRTCCGTTWITTTWDQYPPPS
jgi:hypothetical protein